MDIFDQLNYYSSQITIQNLCEPIKESYTFVENTLNDNQ